MKIVSDQLQRLFRDWEVRHRSLYPKRRDFDPVDFRYILGQMSIIEIHREPLRFLYRLQGSGMTRYLGFDITGKFMDEAPNRAWAALACKHLEEVATTGVPSVASHFDQLVDDHLWNLEALVLPISRDGTTLDMLISAIAHHKRASWITAAVNPHTEIKKLDAPQRHPVYEFGP